MMYLILISVLIVVVGINQLTKKEEVFKGNFGLEGLNMCIEVFDDRVEIRPTSDFISSNLSTQGSETIFFEDVTSVEVKKPFFTTLGYIRISAAGVDSKANEITFASNENFEKANEIKQHILHKKRSVKTNSINDSTSEELNKLTELKNNGVLTEDEFKKAKQKILG